MNDIQFVIVERIYRSLITHHDSFPFLKMSSNRMPLRNVCLQAESSVAPNNRQTSIAKPVELSIETIRCDRLDEETIRFWLELHRSDEQYCSPNYHPEFARAVARVRDDVFVAVIRQRNGQLAGIFPYQRLSGSSADPVGGRMNDYHGVMLAPNAKIELNALVGELGIKRFGFHAVSANKEHFTDYKFETMPSFAIDLTDRYSQYMQWVVRNSQTVKRMPQKVRALNRDHGPVCFEFDCTRPGIIEKLIDLKRDKYIRTQTFDILSVEWAANLIREIHSCRDKDFKGSLSVLWAGNSIAAAHFGMISGNVMQYWFPVFDRRFSKYSPGLQLMMNTVRASCKSGIKRIDLSYGQSKFKEIFANDKEEVLIGSVDFNPISFQIAKQRYRLRMKLKKMPLKEPAKYVLRKVFPGYGRWHFK